MKITLIIAERRHNATLWIIPANWQRNEFVSFQSAKQWAHEHGWILKGARMSRCHEVRQ